MYKLILDHVPRNELLAQLAEECSELASAALHCRRCSKEISPINPTRTSNSDAEFALMQEVADVELLISIIANDNPAMKIMIDTVKRQKQTRWENEIKTIRGDDG